MSKFRRLLVGSTVTLALALTGCASQYHGPQMYRCTFMNTHTNRAYTGLAQGMKQAKAQARHKCHRGPFNWKCVYQDCGLQKR